MIRTIRLLAVPTSLALPLAALPLLAGAAPAAAADPTFPDPSTPPPVPTASDPIAASDVLISEIANGGANADASARASADNFMEITNYGDEPVDVSGWRLLRCGQTGDGYGPQKTFADGTVLAPGDSYTVSGPTASQAVARDAVYDTTGANLHEFGFGGWLETPDHTVVDRVGFYHPSVFSDCGQTDRALDRPLDHRLNQSHQRVAATGDVEADWVVAARTPDSPNATADTERTVDTGLRITEVAGGTSTSDSNQYVELTNTGDTALDITGWKLFRCGENGTAYLQNGDLPAGRLAPGESYVVANAAAEASIARDATYATNMHWRDFGAMVVRPDDLIADRVGFYDNRNSICTAGAPVLENSDQLAAESYHRTADTGVSADDWTLARERSPGAVSAPADLSAPEPAVPGPLRVTELVAAGAAGSADEFVEIANDSDAPVDLAGWSLYRCHGTGQANAGPQVADLGATVGSLAPGETFLAVDDSAPAGLRAQADAEYVTGLNEVDGYGVYLRAPDGSVSDAVAVYETTDHSPCLQFGSELRNYAKYDLGESYQRARATGDNEEDFVVTADRTPGVAADVAWVDPTEPLPGELDPVEIDPVAPPGTPAVERELDDEAYTAVVTTQDDTADGDLDVTARTATPLDTEGTRTWAGSSARAVPTSLRVVGERRVATTQQLTTRGGGSAYPFQRFEVPVGADEAADGVEFTWTGSGLAPRNEVQLRAWDGEAWQLLTAGEPSADGDLTLVGSAEADQVLDGSLNVLVIDGPRVDGGAVDAIGETDRAFLEPRDYDVALSHMTDTQFLSEGFRDVFRRMVTWTAANAEARKIGYATNTGDIVENWMNGNHDPVRARKEFGAASRIWSLLNAAGVPNGVLPGNHDNHWGRNNAMYNEYFGPEMFADQPWWGDSWRPGDNAAHYDFVRVGETDLLVLSLPYRPTQAQIDWGREVAASYPDHNVVLMTHSYLNTEGDIENRTSRYTARGEDLWADLVAPSDNVFLVLGGHYHGVAARYGDPVTGEQVDAVEVANDAVAVRNTGATGRTVLQMLADYQGYRSTQPQPRADTRDRDTGFLRLLQLDLDAELLAVNTFSPHLDSHDAHTYDEAPYRGDQARYTATDDEFVARVDLLRAKAVATEGWSVTGASTEAGSATAAPGEAARLPLPEAADGDLLTVTVTDADGYVVRASRAVSLEPTPLAPTTTELTSTRTSQRYGAATQDRALLTATVSGDGTTEPTGTVELRDGSRVLATVPVVDGRASWRVPARRAVGTTSVEAVFVPAEGEATASSTSTPVSVRVTKALSRTTTRINGTRAVVRVSAPDAAGVRPDGTATVRVTGDGRTRVRTGRLVDGVVRITLPPLADGRPYRVVARYPGDPRVAGSSSPARVVRG